MTIQLEQESTATSQFRRRRGLAWLVLFALLSVQALASLVRLASIPADPKNQIFLGYSSSRLVMLGFLFLAALAAFYLLVRSWRFPVWRDKWVDPLSSRPSIFLFGAAAALFGTVVPWALLIYLRSAGLMSQYTRLSPVALFLILAGLQVLVVLLITRTGLHWEYLSAHRPLLGLSGSILLALIFLWLFLVLTGVGIIPDRLGWGIPGVPLLFLQGLLLAVSAMLLVFAGLARPTSGLFLTEAPTSRSWKIDLFLAGIIWLAAVAIWMAQPLILRSYFAPEVRAPNYEIYPFSDAGFYEFTAQSVLIGEGFQNGEIVPRPLFILILALLNAVGGADYPTLVFLQTLILAAFPVALYFLGKILHSRAAGILVAFMAIVREVNSIAATPLTTVSNSKLLLSDFPTALAIALFTLAVLHWLHAPFKHRWQPLAVGGGLGLLMLIRTQSALLAPFVLLLALLVYWPKRVRWLEASALFALGLVLVITPWLYRNYRITNQIVFDQLTQTVPLADRYSLNGPPKRLPGENDGEYTARLMDSVRKYIIQHPGQVAQFTAAHFFNNEIHTLLALPTLFRPDDLNDGWTVKTPFWENWNGHLGVGGSLLMFSNLILISIGLAAAWKRWRWIGLLPLIIHLAYSASNAAARNSGWRYMLPADWTGYFYAGLGLVQAGLLLFALFGRNSAPVALAPINKVVPSGRFPIKSAALAALACFLAGALVPFSEMMVPERYPVRTSEQLLQEALAVPALQSSGLSAGAMEHFLQQPNAVITKGRLLYPRFYKAGEGEPTNDWRAFMPQDFPRLAFLVLNQQKLSVNLRVEKSPRYFPNAADVILIGCTGGATFDPLMVIVLADKQAVYTRSTTGTTCPLPDVR